MQLGSTGHRCLNAIFTNIHSLDGAGIHVGPQTQIHQGTGPFLRTGAGAVHHIGGPTVWITTLHLKFFVVDYVDCRKANHCFSRIHALIVDLPQWEKYLTLYIVLGRPLRSMPKKQAMWSSIARVQPKKDGKSSLCTDLSTERVDHSNVVLKRCSYGGWSIQG